MTQTTDPAPAETARDTPGVVAPPPLIYLAGLLLGLGLQRRLGSPRRRAAAAPVGGALLAAGVGVAVVFLTTFRRAGTPVDPRRATTALVTTGPYRYTRNPGYLALALIFAGVAVLTGGWALLLLVPTLVVIDRGVIAREERYLEDRFGDEYRSYRGRVRRWL
jgi:protein-S-isoprenylcysteine O-methyltransferase Ste14